MYPTILGRLARGKDGNWELRCNDAGVRVMKAMVGTSLDQWLRSADGFEERDLTAWDDMPHDPSTWPPFRIQVAQNNTLPLFGKRFCGNQKVVRKVSNCLMKLIS